MTSCVLMHVTPCRWPVCVRHLSLTFLTYFQVRGEQADIGRRPGCGLAQDLSPPPRCTAPRALTPGHKLIEREQSQESDEESEDQAVYGAGGGAAAQAAAAAVASGGGAADEEGSETKTPGAAGSHHGLGLVEHEMEAISEFAMGAVWVAQQRALQVLQRAALAFPRGPGLPRC